MTKLRPLNVSVLQFSFCKKRDSSGQPCEDSVKKCLHHAQRNLAWGAVSANAGCTALSHAREEQEVQSCKPDPTAALSGRKPQGWGKEM